MRSPSSTFKERLQACHDGELEQALVRIVILTLVLGYMSVFHGWRTHWTTRDLDVVRTLGGFLAFALAVFAAIWAQPRRNVPRRLVGMLADAGACTWFMWVAGDFGFFALGLYLFITLGNGFRYGRAHLFACQFLCLAGMSAVLMFAPFWEARRVAGFALLTTLVVLPLYISVVLRPPRQPSAAPPG